jgi:lipoprotein-releasing system permease protein
MARGPYEWQIASRYVRSAHRRGFVSFVSLMSVAGLMLGVATLIVVLSVMNGFESELRNRILAVTSHATISAGDGRLREWPEVRAKARTFPGVEAAVPFIEQQAMLQHGHHIIGAGVRGVLPEEERKATGLAKNVTVGHLEDLTPRGYRVILGATLAHELDVKVGDTVRLIAPEGIATPTGVEPRMRDFKVVGLFESGMYEYDSGIALTHIDDAARLFRLGDAVTGVRLALSVPERAPQLVRTVAQSLLAEVHRADGTESYYVNDWTRDHETFFRSIQMSKSMLFVILLLIVGVAAFNIVATLVMVVKEKQTDIAILRTLGAGPGNVLGTFVIQGVLIGLGGTVLGAGLGALVSHNLESLVHGLEHLLGTQFLDARVYYMSDLPAYVKPADVLWVCGIAFLLCALATLYPAWRASRTAPAEALRHE